MEAPLDFAETGHGRVCNFPEEGDILRREALDLLLEACGRGEKFVLRELACSCGRTRDRRRQAASVLQNCAIVVRRDEFGCKTRKMNRAPEAIPSAAEMMASGGRPQSRIDAAEDYRQAGIQNVRK